MAAEQVIEATILAVTPDGNGWSKIQTDQGDFTTKWPEPIAEAMAHVSQRVQIAYEMGEARQSQRTGQWFPAPRYFKRIAGAGYQQPQAFAGQPQQPMQQQPMQQPMQPQPMAQQGGENDPTRALRIMRQTAGKLAVSTMALVPSEQRTFQNQIAVAEAWMRYFVSGPEAVQAQPQPQQPAAPTQEQQLAMMGQGQDDDIPF